MKKNQKKIRNRPLSPSRLVVATYFLLAVKEFINLLPASAHLIPCSILRTATSHIMAHIAKAVCYRLYSEIT